MLCLADLGYAWRPSRAQWSVAPILMFAKLVSYGLGSDHEFARPPAPHAVRGTLKTRNYHLSTNPGFRVSRNR